MKYYVLILICACTLGVFAQENNTTRDTLKTSETEIKGELDEVVVEKKKKAIERKADRVIFDFSEQSHLNSGSLYDGLRKLPGLIISDVAGMLYQGKQLEVYMDGRPLNIYSNELNAYLEGMPANSIEKVEIITQPGAEFPATSGGAIINIITAKNPNRYLSATYSNGYSYTRYGKSRHKFNNSMTLSSANKLFSWQVNGGQSYNEGYQTTRFSAAEELITQNTSDRVNRFYYVKTGIKFDFGKDRLLLNYDVNGNNNNSYVNAFGTGFASDDKTTSKRIYQDAMATYQKRFEDTSKKLDIRLNYNNNTGDVAQLSRITSADILDNNTRQDFYQFKTDYTQGISLLEKGKISAGILADRLDFEAKNFGSRNLKYDRSTYSAYAEGQASYKKFDFIAGARLESYDIHGVTDQSNLIPFSQVRFFPNAAVQYNIMEQVYLKANYSKKISLPNTASLNPNNTSYQNPNVAFFGNPNLQPTIFNNYEVNLSAFEYFNINYSISDADNAIVNRIITTDSGAASISQNIASSTLHNFNIGIPLPYMLFTKGLAETLKMNFNPDEINFMYLYAGSQKNVIPGVDTKAVWNFNIMSQVILPAKVKFTANFNSSTAGGNYYFYSVQRPLSQQLDVTFAKKFLSGNLSASIYANDILNTNKQELGAVGTNLLYYSKYDSRRVGVSLNYKIPTKNKAAREADILSREKQQQQDQMIGN